MRSLLVGLLLFAGGLCAAPKTEILWDQYGVPHIFADSLESMFYAHGWAQMQNHADLLLRLYGESRGRGAEYWGASHLDLDRWVQTNGVPERAQQWYQQQDPTFRKYLDAFARGINDFAKAHPEHTSAEFRVVLPVSGVDVVGHTLRAVHYMYMGSQQRMRNEVGVLVPKLLALNHTSEWNGPPPEAGSNTWAVGPSRSASGKAMLIINPHLLWGEFYTYMEVHLVAPGYDLYGTPQIGFPVPVIGFNRRAGWGRTVNTIDTVDFYRLTTRDGKYEFDGDLRAFESAVKTLKVKQADGSMREEKLTVRRSVQGPVVFDEDGVTVSMRVAGIDRPKMLEQWFRMGGAQNLEEFKTALRIESVPMWNANYADADGHIMLVFNGLVPKRKIEDWQYWSKVVPGNTSKTLWTEYHSFDDLPKSIDPPSGFNQNTNEPPWLSTFPQLDPAKYPAYIAPPNTRMPSFRTMRSLRMITENKSITYDQLLAYKHSTRMELADALLPDLLKAAGSANDPVVKEAAGVLAQWDRQTETNSRGAVLFQIFADRYFGKTFAVEDKLRVKYDPQRPLESASGLADSAAAIAELVAAAQECRRVYGSLDVPWGDVYRYVRGKKDLPGNGDDGKMGVFRTVQYTRKEGNKYYVTHGETFVCAVEFGTPQRAQCLLGYGNASQPGSAHIDDQLQFMVEKKLLPVLRERKDIEAHLERKEAF